VESRVQLLFPVVVFPIEVRNKFVYLLLVLLILEISYTPVSWVLPVPVWVSKFLGYRPSLT